MTIADFFKGKCIFITGGSGFIGKVLIEKLLRSCDGIEKIYVLLRKKENIHLSERIKQIIDCELMDTVKKINPKAVEKLIPICGDVSKPKLDLNEEDIQTLVDNVDIIYHAAASVRFDDHLKDSILLNTRGTKEVIEIALQAKKVVTFVHVSTTYCNCDRFEVEERLYPPHADWKSTITLAEKTEQHTLDILSPQYIYPLPNTYTFAKSLSEQVVNDLCKGKVLATIARPSIVVPSLDEPIPGWADNFNGPLGLLCAGGKGILRICYGDENNRLDCIPVDILVKFLILITYKRTLSNDLDDVPVYNTALGEDVCVKNGDFIQLGSKLTWDAPYTNIFWYPSFSMTNNWYKFYAVFLLYHMIPALIVDGLLTIIGKKPLLIKIQRKIYLANTALAYFMQNSFKFKNKKCKTLEKCIQESDNQSFRVAHCFNYNDDEVYRFYIKSKITLLRVLFKEDYNRIKGFRNTMILWICDNLLHILIYSFLCWFLTTKLKILTVFGGIISSYLFYLNEL